jgi:hypothetical protein
MFLGASAQMASGGDGFTYDNTSAASNCLVNNLPSTGGLGFNGGNFTSANIPGGDGSFTLVTGDEIEVGVGPAWFFIHETVGEGTDAQCSPLGENGGVDMSSQSAVTILAKSGNVNDTLEFFLGSGTGFPSSTYNTGAGANGVNYILARHGFSKAGEYELFSFDFASLDAAVWDAWTNKNAIHQIGFRSATAGATFNVLKVGLGSSNGDIINSTSNVAKASVSVYPNPATDVLNVAVGAGNANVQLSSVTGAVVASANGSGNVVLSTSTVPAGLYVVTVNSASGTTTSKVVIK